jgi:hypothetical protein
MVRIGFTAEPGERRSAQGNGSDVRPSHAETARGKFWKVLTKMLFGEESANKDALWGKE